MVRDWVGEDMLKARCSVLGFVANTRSNFALGNAKLLVFIVRVCITASSADGMNKPFMCAYIM